MRTVTTQAWGPVASRWGGRPSGGGRIQCAKHIRPRLRRLSRRSRATTKPVGAGPQVRGGKAPEQTLRAFLLLTLAALMAAGDQDYAMLDQRAMLGVHMSPPSPATQYINRTTPDIGV